MIFLYVLLYFKVFYFFLALEGTMFLGQKIRLWKYHVETRQFLVDQQFMLTVTEDLGDGKYTGTLEDGSVYSYENGVWWAESAEGEMKLDMAMHIWNIAMRKAEYNMRVLLLPEGRNIEPDGDVEKCEKHNRYFLSGNRCLGCRMDARATAIQ
jgi:hypothetical protein